MNLTDFCLWSQGIKTPHKICFILFQVWYRHSCNNYIFITLLLILDIILGTVYELDRVPSEFQNRLKSARKERKKVQKMIPSGQSSKNFDSDWWNIYIEKVRPISWHFCLTQDLGRDITTSSNFGDWLIWH